MDRVPPAFQRQIGFLEPEEQLALAACRVAVLGLGGVGGVAAELLARAGVGALAVCDGDAFETGNLNRQVGALGSTLGQDKAEVMARRLREINPDLAVEVLPPVGSPGWRPDMLAGLAAGVLAMDALRPALLALRQARALGVALAEALPLPVIQVRAFDPRGPEMEQGWPSQGRDLENFSGAELAGFFQEHEAVRWRDAHGAPLALPPGLLLATARLGSARSLGPLVWLAGSLAALEVLKIITGRGKVAWHQRIAAFDPCQWGFFLAS